MNKTSIIFTCQAESSDLCLNELASAISGAKFILWLAAGVGLLEASGDFVSISERLRGSRLIFTRHIFPVDHAVDISGTETLEHIHQAVGSLSGGMDADKPYSIQIRALTPGNSPLAPSDILPAASDLLQSMGFALNIARPHSIISMLICGDVLYMGLSSPEHSLSAWPGGMRHYAKYDGQISRAEFKLLEALEACGLKLDPSSALDLGAAPGGWTKVLLDIGMSVTTVDPADLSPALAGKAGLQHHKMPAQEFFKKYGAEAGLYGVVVNDMRIDIPQSAGIMLQAHDLLTDGGYAVMTFKLPPAKKLAAINKGLELLSGKYEVILAKQLFHNRSEITVVMRKG